MDSSAARHSAPGGSALGESGFRGLDPCVHCGFCLPACPTYLVTGDEADSPRGRILLMRALEQGELAMDDPGLVEHLDACLGCRGCEPVCPSGVEYGRGLEAARTLLAREGRGLGARARAILGVFAREPVWRGVLGVGRMVRSALGGSALGARRAGGVAAALNMLAATRPVDLSTLPHAPRVPSAERRAPSAEPPSTEPRVALFTGCVMDGLFRHVHDATRRVLEANGYAVVEPEGQVCCGALHDHAGDRGTAQRLARDNVRALADSADFIVVNSAGCGALLKDYGHLLGDAGAAAFGAKVRDVTELLVAAGPRRGAPLPIDVAYDAPCHLQHAQRVQAEPLAVLAAIPELRVQVLPGSSLCCGSAGIYSMLEPAMSERVLAAKIAELAAAVPRPRLVATGNPGCLMQIGAGLRAAGLDIGVVHPVELLDESYRRATG